MNIRIFLAHRIATLIGLTCLISLAAGCATNEPNKAESQTPVTATTNKNDSASASAKKDNGTPSAGSANAGNKGPGPGMNSKGEVIDSSKVESGYGRKVKGRGDREGEITGIPGPKSKFAKLEIGMSMREAMDIAGQPTDQGAYITGKAFIPFYFGGDRHRYELTYKGQGRLVFAGENFGNMGGGNLIWIIHSATDSGYR